MEIVDLRFINIELNSNEKAPIFQVEQMSMARVRPQGPFVGPMEQCTHSVSSCYSPGKGTDYFTDHKDDGKGGNTGGADLRAVTTY